MSQEDRKLMRLIDEHILNASSEELTRLQQADISTQLDGVWFYDHYTSLHQKSQQKIQTKNKF